MGAGAAGFGCAIAMYEKEMVKSDSSNFLMILLV
jgi:hypothetical protein